MRIYLRSDWPINSTTCFDKFCTTSSVVLAHRVFLGFYRLRSAKQATAAKMIKMYLVELIQDFIRMCIEPWVQKRVNHIIQGCEAELH